MYNRASLVGRAISSVLAQTVSHWELLLIDDGSTDGSSGTAHIYARDDERIIVHQQAHRGRVAARSAGVAQARAPLITFLDSDDYYERDHLEHQLAHFIDDPGLSFLSGVPKVIGYPYVFDAYQPDREIPIQECAVQGTFFVSRPVFDQVGHVPSVPFGEDLFFFERVKELGVKRASVLMPTYVLDRTRKTPHEATPAG